MKEHIAGVKPLILPTQLSREELGSKSEDDNANEDSTFELRRQSNDVDCDDNGQNWSIDRPPEHILDYGYGGIAVVNEFAKVCNRLTASVSFTGFYVQKFITLLHTFTPQDIEVLKSCEQKDIIKKVSIPFESYCVTGFIQIDFC